MQKQYSTIIDGQEVFCDTPEALFQLIRAGKAMAAGPVSPQEKMKRPKANSTEPKPRHPFKRMTEKPDFVFFQFLKQKLPRTGTWGCICC